jgi:hypothetical protein
MFYDSFQAIYDEKMVSCIFTFVVVGGEDEVNSSVSSFECVSLS